MIWDEVSLAKVSEDIEKDLDLLKKYQRGLRSEQRRKERNAKKIAWYKEHVQIAADALRRHIEYKKVCELRQQKIFQNIEKQH